jgi:hypothetical protein
MLAFGDFDSTVGIFVALGGQITDKTLISCEQTLKRLFRVKALRRRFAASNSAVSRWCGSSRSWLGVSVVAVIFCGAEAGEK